MEDGFVVNEAGRNMGNRELVFVDKFTFFDVGRTDLGGSIDCRFPPVKKEKADNMKNWQHFHLPAAKADKLSRDVLQT
jgi:hypothetical protein